MTADARADEAVARAIDILADLVGFDTTSHHSNLALMRHVETLLARHGVVARLLFDESGQKANLFATIGPARPDGVILSGHTDVVPVADQHWSSDPFALTQRDGRLYGRGTADMKSFIACTLAALEFTRPEALERPIHLAFSYDEEIGCLGVPGLIDYIQETIMLPALAIVGEPSLMRIIGSHKSVNIYRVSITGQPAHSSAVHLGLSANILAVRLMAVLLDIADGLRSDDMQDATFEPPFSTLTIGVMNGGTAANILAAEASFVFDLRSLPSRWPDEILEPFIAAIESMRAAHPCATITFERLATVPPLARVLDSKAEGFVRSVGGDNSDTLTGSFGAEAGQFQQAGFSTVICGPGSIDQAHQADEFVEIVEIEKCIAFMRKLFAAMSVPSAA